MTHGRPPRRAKAAPLGPVECAVIAQKWRSYALDGQIHAAIGEHTPAIISYCGRMCYVALSCARAIGIEADDVDLRIVRGTVEALHDQVSDPVLREARRGALISGTKAALRISQRASDRTIATEAMRMELLLRQKHLTYSDFKELVK